MNTLVIIPTYNERENLAELLPLLRKTVPDAHVLVVDDNSPDGTGAFAQDIAARDAHVHVLSRPRKEGLARAYVDGFGWALQRDYECVVTMDGDMSHHPSYIPAFLEEIQRNDVVIGSRWIPGGGVRDWNLYRRFISRGATLYAKLVLGIPVEDCTGGFNAYRRKLLEDIGPQNIRADGYGFQIEMKYRAWRKRYRLKEVPIVFPDRRKGKTKFSRRIVLEAIFLVLKLRFLAPASNRK